MRKAGERRCSKKTESTPSLRVVHASDISTLNSSIGAHRFQKWKRNTWYTLERCQKMQWFPVNGTVIQGRAIRKATCILSVRSTGTEPTSGRAEGITHDSCSCWSVKQHIHDRRASARHLPGNSTSSVPTHDSAASWLISKSYLYPLRYASPPSLSVPSYAHLGDQTACVCAHKRGSQRECTTD